VLYGAASTTTGHVWYEGNAERMRIADNGMVGIGTNSPTALLEVAGDVSASITSTGSFGALSIGGGSGKTLSVKGASGDIARFEHNGSVGSVDIYSGTDGGLVNVRSGSGTSVIELDARNDRVLLADNIQLKLGTGGDFVAFHNGSNTFLRENTNDLYIDQLADDKDIIFRSDNGSGGVTSYFYLDGSATKTVFAQSTQHADNAKATFGAAGDMEIYHDGTNSVINNTTGDLQIYNNLDDKDIVFLTDDGSGGTTAYLTLDGSDTSIQVAKNMEFADSVQANFGNKSGGDMQIYHDGSNNYINASEGHLILEQNENDHDIYLKSDNGSGGTTAYLTLDGSTTDLSLTPPSNITRIANDGGASDEPKLQLYRNSAAYAQMHYEPGGGDSSGFHLTDFRDDANSHIVFNTRGDNERMRIESDGKVGIGNTAPTEILVVEGNISGSGHIVMPKGKISGSGEDLVIQASSNGLLLQTGGANTRYNLTNTGTHNIFGNTSFSSPMSVNYGATINEGGNDSDTRIEGNSDANLVRVDAGNDRVGIGTGTPGTKLEVIGSISGSLTSTGSFGALVIDPLHKGFTIGNHNNKARIIYNAGYFQFTDADNSYGGIAAESGSFYGDVGIRATKKLYFDDGEPPVAGNTYISETSNGILRLQVDGENMLELSSAGSDPRISYFNKDNRDRDFSFCGDTNDGALYFDASAERVGINTSTPDTDLSINTTDDGSVTFTRDGGHKYSLEHDASQLYLYNRTLNKNQIMFSHSGPVTINNDGHSTIDFRIEGDTDQYLFFSDASADKIGIGTSAPTTLLDISGSMNLHGSMTINNEIKRSHIFVKGTGLNQAGNANRVVTIAGHEVCDTTSPRGLRLDVIDGLTHQVVTSSTHDTYGNGAASNALAVTLNAFTSSNCFGVLTSYDAIENSVTLALKHAATNQGLTKLAGISTNSLGTRHAYAALFNIRGNNIDTGLHHNHDGIIEVLASNDRDDRNAIISTHLTSYFSEKSSSAIEGGHTINALHVPGGDHTPFFVSQSGTMHISGSGRLQFDSTANYPNLVFPANHSADKIRLYAGGNEKIGTAANTIIYTAETHQFKDTDGNVILEINTNGQAEAVEFISSNGIFESDDASTNLKLRRGPNDDDIIEIEASETKIYGDAVERVRFGSYGIRSNYIGSAGTPPYSFVADTNTGIYSSGADSLNVTTGGSERVQINSLGLKVVNGALGVNATPNGTDGRIDASNDVVAFSSDKRLKQNIRFIENPLEKVSQLSGFIYNWNEKANKEAGYDMDKDYVGVFAQDVEKIQPEAVKIAPFDNDGTDNSKSGENYLTVQYEKLVPLLIESIKELKKEIEELKKQ